MNGKIKVSARMIVEIFDQSSGIALEMAEIIRNKKWRSAWLILHACFQKCWFNVDRVYWKTPKSVPSPIVIDDNKENILNSWFIVR